MSSRPHASFVCSLLVLGFSCLSVGPLLAAGPQLSESVVLWPEPAETAAILTVSGPGGLMEWTFTAGETPTLGLHDLEGEPLEDGLYTWQLITQPALDAAAQKGIQEARLAGRRVSGEAVRGSKTRGTLRVSGGVFLLPSEEQTEAPQNDTQVDANKDQVIADDLIVDGSLCVGLDCVNAESFGTDVIRLKENTVRLRFLDTSNAPFPTNDWQLVANDSSSGGAEKFSIEDASAGRIPFTLRAGAPNDALFVSDSGRIGLGTATPAEQVHVTHGDTPTLRLDQDGSLGFGAQAWDLGGNEASFFVRDVSDGNKLPLRIRSGAPTASIDVQSNGKVGINTSSPSSTLHVRRNDGTARLTVEDSTATDGTYTLLELETSGGNGRNIRPRFTMTHGGVPASWNFDILNNGSFAFIRNGGAVFTYGSNGNLTIEGNFISDGTTLNVPDFVFADDYDLMPLDQLQAFVQDQHHLPDIPSATTVQQQGLDITDMQLKLLQKVEELTLYTLDQHETIRDQQEIISDQQSSIQAQQKALEALQLRLEALESRK